MRNNTFEGKYNRSLKNILTTYRIIIKKVIISDGNEKIEKEFQKKFQKK